MRKKRVSIPVTGSPAIGYLLYCYFPDARGSGVPPTKAAKQDIREWRILAWPSFGLHFLKLFHSGSEPAESEEVED